MSTGRRSRSGPSPRAWGELRQVHHGKAMARTIPTRVGRTMAIKEVTITMADHPHARGENAFLLIVGI